jgi:hypothetical protein
VLRSTLDVVVSGAVSRDSAATAIAVFGTAGETAMSRLANMPRQMPKARFIDARFLARAH